jgi:hypothetical protein
MKIMLCIFYEPGFPKELYISNPNGLNMIPLENKHDVKLSLFIEDSLRIEYGLDIASIPREYRVSKANDNILVKLFLSPGS